ncbi:DUF6515 family protein, partial [Kistimonas scapharcae]|uniref:DUF6515 family protein n=1 Tax=Kistimonas scapharcae TaxID=1036133 RepID=UPI0031E6DCC1
FSDMLTHLNRVSRLPLFVCPENYNHFKVSFTSLYVKGKLYYYREGVFYDKTSSGHYQSVPAPAGAIIEKLPAGAVEVRENNRVYWKAGDTWYEPIGSRGETVYRVVR